MSLNSKKSPLAVRVRNSQTLEEALFEEGVDLVAGRLENTFQLNSRDLTIEEIEFIQSLPADGYDNFLQLLEGKSPGAKYLAWQCYHATTRDKEFDLAQTKKDWAAVKELRYWAKSRTEDLKACGLGYDEYLTEGGWTFSSHVRYYNHEVEATRFHTCAETLLNIGIRFDWQAERFVNLYKEVMNGSRSWRSCYQVSQEKIGRAHV